MKKILICAVLCFFCTSCETPKEKIEFSDTLRMAAVCAKSFNPYYETSEVTKEILALIYEPLFSYDKDFKIRPVLAESAYVSEDGMSVEVCLKKDISWHDGAAFSADNVLYTVSTLISSGFCGISSADKIDDYTIKINFTRLYMNPVEQLTFYIIKNAEPIGTGEFGFFGKISADTYLLKRMNGEGSISEIKVISCPDERSAKQLFEIGEIDILASSSVNYNGFNGRVFEYPTNNMVYLGVNFESVMLSGEKTRQSLMYLINKADITDKLLHKKATPADFPINPSCVFYPKNKEYTKNTKTAEDLLRRDGWQRKDGVFLRLPEERLSLRLFSAREELLPVAEYICSAFYKFGIDCEVTSDASNYDLILDTAMLNSAADFSNIGYKTDAALNMERLIRNADNDEIKKAYYEKCADIILSDAYLIPLCFENTAFVLGANAANWDVRK